jgi:hypothetical protein
LVTASSQYTWIPEVDLLSEADSTEIVCESQGANDDTLSFRYRGLSDGGYALRSWYWHNGRHPWWYPGTSDRRQAEIVRVESGAVVTTGPWGVR